MSNLDGAASNKTQDILRMPSPEGGLDPQIATPTIPDLAEPHSSPTSLDSVLWRVTAEQVRILEERYANGTLVPSMGPEWLGEYYERHLNDHAKDLEAALENCLLRAEQDELRGLFTSATHALEALDGDVNTATPSSPGHGGGRGSSRSRSVYTPSLSHYSSSPVETGPPEPAVVESPSPVQPLVEEKATCELPARSRKSHCLGYYHAFKHRVEAWRKWRWPMKGKKGKREKETGDKTERNSSSGSSQQEEGKRK